MEKTLPFPVWDPNFFRDDDGKVYLYWGCSDVDPIKVVELNRKMQPVNSPLTVITHNPSEHGWENPGELNEKAKNGYNEGSMDWMFYTTKKAATNLIASCFNQFCKK